MVTRTDLWLLAILREQKADNFMVAISIDELMEVGADGIARITIYKHMKKLVKEGYVGAGAKADRASSFFITEKGKTLFI